MLHRAEAIRRTRAFETPALPCREQPLAAEDLAGRVERAVYTSIPIAAGEPICHQAHFREYLAHLQLLDRSGGCRPGSARSRRDPKGAHLAETFNVSICPHLLMEPRASLNAAAANAAWIEYIPQLSAATAAELTLADGQALAPGKADPGTDRGFAAIERRAVVRARIPA